MKDPVFLSIILPVYDRVREFRKCLECLAQQKLDHKYWELFIVSDGGPKEIESCSRAFELLLPMRFHRQENAGPARARNYAMSKARGQHFIFLNDDIRFDEYFLNQYFDFLSDHPDHAITGNTRWAQEIIKDEFAYWVSQQDHTFYNITDRLKAPWEFWHTLNASVPRKYFDDGELFDETYPDPAFEDTEYIYRLQKKHDLRIAFLPDAIVEHVHPFEFESFCEKAKTRGMSAARFVGQYPELSERILAVSSDDAAKQLIKSSETRGIAVSVQEMTMAGHASFLTGYLEGKQKITNPREI